MAYHTLTFRSSMKSGLATSPSLLKIMSPTFTGEPTRHMIFLYLRELLIPSRLSFIIPCWVDPVLMYTGHLTEMACPGSMNLAEPCNWHIPILVRFSMGWQTVELIRLLPPLCRCPNPSIPYECIVVKRHAINAHLRNSLRSSSLRRIPTTLIKTVLSNGDIKR